MPFECVSKTDVGLRRKVNEDALLVRTERGLWAVADGMGGHDAGDVASARVTQALLEIPIVYNLEDMVENVVLALKRVNHELIGLAETMGSERTIGSTVVGLAIANGEYRCFWAGDSRAYRVRGNEIKRLTRDHSLVQGLVDAGMLSEEEAEEHPSSNIITRAVGVAEELNVDVVSGDARPGDQFLLASDGLTRLVANREMLAELTSRRPRDAVDNLIEMVLKRGAPDNVSIILTKPL